METQRLGGNALKRTMELLGLILALLILAGCAGEKSETSAGKPISFEPELAADLQEQVKNLERVEDCVLVVYDQKVSAAVQVSGLDRLHLKAVRENVHHFLSEALKNDYTVYVTTDKKLYRSLQEITRLKLKNLPKREAQNLGRRLEKINQDMQG